jgi:hypothetical protein
MVVMMNAAHIHNTLSSCRATLQHQMPRRKVCLSYNTTTHVNKNDDLYCTAKLQYVHVQAAACI